MADDSLPARGASPALGDAALLTAALDALPLSIFIQDKSGGRVFTNARGLRSASSVSQGDAMPAHGPTDLRLFPITQDGEPVGAIGVETEWSGVVEARDALTRERSRLRDFIQCSSDWIWEQDENFVFTNWHMPQEARFALPHGKTRWEFAGADPETNPFWRKHKEDLERHLPIENFVFQTKGLDGQPIWLEINGRPVHDESGAFRGYRGVGKDVTARELLNSQLRHAELVVRNTDSMVIICDAQRRITYVNPAFERASGYSLAEAAGRSPGALLRSPEADPAIAASIRHALDKGEDIKVETLNQRRDGEPYWIDMAIRPVRGEDGAVSGYISVASDITEMVALRRRLMAIFENVPACIVLFDEEGVILDCNREVEALTGLPKSLVIGLRCSDYEWSVFSDMGPPYATQEHPVYVALREGRQVEGVVIGFMRGRVAADDPNGELRWLKGNINPVKLDGGRRIAIFSFSDISDEIATQALLRGALAETQKTLAELCSYKAALDQHSLLTVVDRDRRLTFVNDMFCAVSGYTREEALGKTLAELVNSDQHPVAFYRELDRTIRAGKTWRSLICNRAKDGQLFWLDETVVPQTNEAGEIVAHISMSFNVTERVLAERQRSESEARYKLLADNSNDVIILGHNDGRRTYYSPAIRRLTGHTPEEALTVTMREWVHPDDLPGVYRATAGLSEAQPTTTIVHRLRRKDGIYIWVEGAFSRVMTASGEPCIIANIRDVTGRKVIEEEYRNLYAHAIVGIYRKTLDGRLTRANPALVALRGYGSEAELMAAYNAGQANWYVDPGRRAERQERLLRDGLVTDFVSQVSVPNRKEPLWISETAWLMRDDTGRPSYIEGMVADVTERMTSQAALEKLARNDVLTNLPNRMALCEAVEEALEQGSDVARSLIYVDLDRFKAVNDSHGHAAGDEVVREVARRLGALSGENDLLARLGGDEFALLVRETASLTRAEQLAIQIIAAVNRPIALSCGQYANVGASIGIAQVQSGEASAESVIRRADLAMYQAKRDGRNAFRRYTAALDEQVALRQTIDLGLRMAIEKQQFELHFQPVFEASTVAHAGFEALIRWRHPEQGLMSPAHFVPIAEETGMIVPIGEWVLDEALRQAAAWPPHCRISINASVVQLRRPEFASVVMAALARHNVAPGRLEIEVTESVLLDDSPATLAVLQKLQLLGVHVALDDFGTGWSSLSYLNRHRFDRIKIDRSFVNGMNDLRNEAIIRTIVDLGDRLGIQITAEGVEKPEELEALAKLGCHEVQGYLLGKPMPAAQAAELAARHANLVPAPAITRRAG